jgi:hypothetical protein
MLFLVLIPRTNNCRTLTLLHEGLCGDLFAVHAGGGISFGPSTKITGGEVGLASRGFNLAQDVMAYKRNATLIPAELGDTAPFTAGYYRASTLNIAAGSTVILDGNNDPDAHFIFYSDTTMITGAISTIELRNGANAKNVFWVLGTTLTTGALTTFKGSISAGTDITFGEQTEVEGCVAAVADITYGTDNHVTTNCATAGGSICSLATTHTYAGII